MKRSFFLILSLSALLLSGCDFMRTVAGRPTSKDLEAKRTAIEQAREAARYQARMDSLEQVRAREADSLAALDARLLDSLSRTRGIIMTSRKLGGLSAETGLTSRYFIVVGAFKTRAYAERKLARCAEAGYPDGAIIGFRNGLLAVAVCPSDSLNETLKKLRELRGNGICPKDGWILVNE